MTINSKFVLSPPLDQYFVDKDTGLPLAEGTITFYIDSARNEAKPVYQLVGNPPDYDFVPVIDPITLSAVGTLQNAGGDNICIYFYPFEGDPSDNSDVEELYYIVCRDKNGTLQWTREGWPAGAGGGSTPIQTGESSLENQISNPQFTRMLLNEGVTTTFSFTDATPFEAQIAPDWYLLVTGTAATNTSVQVTREAILGSANVATSPPYVLHLVTSAGINSCRLRQRLNVNSGLWASTVTGANSTLNYLAASITGIATGADTQVDIIYKESTGNSEQVLLAAVLPTDAYTTRNATVLIPSSTDTDSGTSGYVDIFVSIPTSSEVRISSIQVLPVSAQSIIPYDLQSSNRMQTNMGDWYIPRLEAKPIPSLLVGWDFPLNPAQLGSSGTLLTQASADYIWDQTIGAASESPGTTTYDRAATTSALHFTTVAANNSFYILQYLSAAQAKKFLGTTLSVNVNAYKTAGVGAVTMRVYLFRGSTATSVVPVLPLKIGSVSTAGVFTLNTAVNQGLGWTEIPRGNLDTAMATLSTVSSNTDFNSPNNNYAFSGWQVTTGSEIIDTDKVAIIVTFGYGGASTEVFINTVSVVPGDIPTKPAPQTADEVLRECKYYYEQTYNNGIVPGAVTDAGRQMFPFPLFYDNTNRRLIPCSFTFNYQTKRAVPTINFYSPTAATVDQIYIASWVNGVASSGPFLVPTAGGGSGYSAVSQTVSSVQMVAVGSGTPLATIANAPSSEGVALWQAKIDARLGKV